MRGPSAPKRSRSHKGRHYPLQLRARRSAAGNQAHACLTCLPCDEAAAYEPPGAKAFRNVRELKNLDNRGNRPPGSTGLRTCNRSGQLCRSLARAKERLDPQGKALHARLTPKRKNLGAGARLQSVIRCVGSQSPRARASACGNALGIRPRRLACFSELAKASARRFGGRRRGRYRGVLGRGRILLRRRDLKRVATRCFASRFTDA
jgi:hypothetical protein